MTEQGSFFQKISNGWKQQSIVMTRLQRYKHWFFRHGHIKQTRIWENLARCKERFKEAKIAFERTSRYRAITYLALLGQEIPYQQGWNYLAGEYCDPRNGGNMRIPPQVFRHVNV